jgi:hypothetical protein
VRKHLTQPAAAVKRISSPPPDAGLDRLLADPALCSTAKAVALALVRRWAWSKAACWPSDATIAGTVGRSPGHVQRCLRQLERAGWIERERTAEVPNGRRIWLRWRRDVGSGAQPTSAPARSAPPAPARSERIVIVNELRTEPIRRQIPARLRDEPTPRPPDARERVEAAPTPVDPQKPQPTPQRPGATPSRRRWLTTADLAAAVASTGDAILARELARLTAPPPQAEPPVTSQSTAELLARLPGRHDLVLPVARRLCLETGDEKPATLRTFEGMCHAVACRSVPVEAITSSWRQASGPLARHRGKVMVAAWGRAVGRRC